MIALVGWFVQQNIPVSSEIQFLSWASTGLLALLLGVLVYYVRQNDAKHVATGLKIDAADKKAEERHERIFTLVNDFNNGVHARTSSLENRMDHLEERADAFEERMRVVERVAPERRKR